MLLAAARSRSTLFSQRSTTVLFCARLRKPQHVCGRDNPFRIFTTRGGLSDEADKDGLSPQQIYKKAKAQVVNGTPGPDQKAPAASINKKKDVLADTSISNKEQRKADWAIMKEMVKYLWPKGDWGTKMRVGTALTFLVGGKILNVEVPFYFKSIVDSMNIDFAAVGGTAWTVAGSMLIAYGASRIGATLFQELRNAVFASVAQKAIRKVAGNVFNHLLRLDLNFHLSRQTGGLTRAIDRGTKGISFLLTSMVFHVFPTALEISMVCGILVCSVPCRQCS
jgi:ATP-binding cassette, subfamily B (MDR/TAP), member 7